MRSLIADLIALRLYDGPDGPMNNALYRILREAIFEGRLAAQTRLPASRDLSSELKIARNTVVHAYRQLQAEGYIDARPGSGTFVADVLPDEMMRAVRRKESSLQKPRPGHTRPDDVAAGEAPSSAVSTAQLSSRGRRLVRDAAASPHQWGAFMPGVPDVNELPRERLAKLFRDAWRKPTPSLLTYGHSGGLPDLKVALAEYLSVSRSLNCSPEQIVITEGSHQAIDLVTRMLTDVGDAAWVEDPGYWGARATMHANGIDVIGMPVDADGMCPPQRQPDVPPKFIFLTPSHQYPLGSVMSMQRRLQFLALARQWGAWIIEDDYDSEIRFSGNPIAAMQGLEVDAPVIYLGTFSKTLYPGLRLAYLVLPVSLAKVFKTAQAELYREGHFMTQSAIAAFIQQGDFTKHIRRMRLLYGQRRKMLAHLIERRLGQGWLHDNGSEAGLHLVINLPEGMDDKVVQEDIHQHGVLTRALSRYYMDAKRSASGLVLGYACVPESQIAARFEVVVAALARQMRKM